MLKKGGKGLESKINARLNVKIEIIRIKYIVYNKNAKYIFAEKINASL